MIVYGSEKHKSRTCLSFIRFRTWTSTIYFCIYWISKSHDPTQTQYGSSLLRHELWECDSLGSTLKTKYHKLSRFEMSIRYQWVDVKEIVNFRSVVWFGYINSGVFCILSRWITKKLICSRIKRWKIFHYICMKF